MFCPLCKEKLDNALFYGVEVDYCPFCLGMFFEQDELRLAKDERDSDLKWLDIDLWKEGDKFKVAQGKKLCPVCRFLLYEVNYGESDIRVDLCNICKGVWLDRGEFKKIIEYLKERAADELMRNWAKNLKEELWEVFTGPETFREELLDFLTLLKLLNYKFFIHHRLLATLIAYQFVK